VFGALLTAPYGLALHELADVISLVDDALLASFANDPVTVENDSLRCSSIRVFDLVYTAQRFGLLSVTDSLYGHLVSFGHPEVGCFAYLALPVMCTLTPCVADCVDCCPLP
jgi:hypothetical protein